MFNQHSWKTWCLVGFVVAGLCVATHDVRAAEFRGRIVDAETRRPLEGRVYLRGAAGAWHFVESADAQGSARAYREQWVPMPDSVELHTTVSAHAFRCDLAPGEYHLEVERGKEYLPWSQRIVVQERGLDKTIELKRWIDMARLGWYSGETHVHRRIGELPNVLLAEDLNVAFPVTFWTIRSDKAPDLTPSPLRSQGPSPFGPREDRGVEPIYVDPTHVMLPRNTEYEIFSIGDRRHVLGAIFVLNHRSVFATGAPPIRAIAEQAHAEGALLDLDKHAWPWSMMLVPVAKIDLFELSNNSVWRTKFGFKQAVIPPANWMNLEMESPGQMTEWGWLNFGFEVYYALLNCGFRIAPTAGTASGVHPVPLGYSRVYVQSSDARDPTFKLKSWLAGLRRGCSFVTTGPMLVATAGGEPPGKILAWERQEPRTIDLKIEVQSIHPVTSVDILVNGSVVHHLEPHAEQTPAGSWKATCDQPVRLSDSSWIAVRAIEAQPDGRKRFAHSAPWYFEMAGRPVLPRREQIDYFVRLMEREIERNRDVLSADALAEFQQALDEYRRIAERARD